jgi:hypothetical protein
MILTNKLLPVALIAALIGGSVGALVMHKSQPAAAETMTSNNAQPVSTDQAITDANQFNTAGEQTAYKTGFADGYDAASRGTQTVAPAGSRATTSTRRTANRTVARNSAPQRVYYDYSQPRKRSFWDKHRDKLTVAIGTGAGAAVGGLIGGKKGAAIGALSGAGGSALWTYKLRNRDRNY